MKTQETSPTYQTVFADEDSRILRISDATGEGLMTFYQVMPGVSVIFSDFHMSSFVSDFKPNYDMLCIDHCREGRIEHEVGKGAYTYFQAGDLKIDNRVHHVGRVEMPTKHFHGVSIVFDLKVAPESLRTCMAGFPVDLYALQKKFCDDAHPFVIPGEASIAHIFSEFYAVPMQIREYYLKVKVLELLLFLDALELSTKNRDARPYFYKTQVEKIKAIHQLLTSNLSEHYTLESLSKRFDIPLTAMKSCFKSVYGDSVFSYMRGFRMHHAAHLLREQRDMSIAEIAGIVGYDSPGKFSTAFKSIMGTTPLAYRKSPVHSVNLWLSGEETK